MLEQSQKKFYVHIIRDEQIWKIQHETGIDSGHKFEAYAVESDGNMIAYFRISEKPEEKTLVLLEATDTNIHTGKAILRFLKDKGKQHGLETLISRLSYMILSISNLLPLVQLKTSHHTHGR